MTTQSTTPKPGGPGPKPGGPTHPTPTAPPSADALVVVAAKPKDSRPPSKPPKKPINTRPIGKPPASGR